MSASKYNFSLEDIHQQNQDSLNKALLQQLASKLASIGSPTSSSDLALLFKELGEKIVAGKIKKPEQRAEVVRLCTLGAEKGYPPAQNSLGLCYQRGFGVKKDAKEAVQLYRLAANQGYADAQYNLGYCCYHGINVKENLWLYPTATGQNEPGLCYRLERGREEQAKEAVQCYLLAANQGHAGAQFRLGYCYQDGHGVVKNEKEAMRFFRLAADQGYKPAHYALGLCYEDGLGVEKDAKAAIKFYRSIAKENDDAQKKLLENQDLLLKIEREEQEKFNLLYESLNSQTTFPMPVVGLIADYDPDLRYNKLLERAGVFGRKKSTETTETTETTELRLQISEIEKIIQGFKK